MAIGMLPNSGHSYEIKPAGWMPFCCWEVQVWVAGAIPAYGGLSSRVMMTRPLCDDWATQLAFPIIQVSAPVWPVYAPGLSSFFLARQ